MRLVDRIANINHDIDDAIRAGVLRAADLPRAEIDLLGDTGSRRIDTLVRDVIEQFEQTGDIAQGAEVGEAMMSLRAFMFENVYLAASAKSEHPRIAKMIRVLFDHYVEQPPAPMTPGASEAERIVDWLAGMTDRFALRAFTELSVPRGF